VRPWPERAAPALLLAAAAASAALLLALGAGMTFFSDEWDLILHRREWSLDALLRPHAEHLAVLPAAAYKGLLEVFGMESTLPFRALATALLLANAALLFVYVRRRVGDWLALMGCVIILFLGAAWEDLLWPFGGMVWGGATAFGLGMLLALQREDRLGDAFACVLLLGSLAFSSLGVAFAAGAAAEVVLRHERWRSRAYIFAVPLLLYALWYLGWGQDTERALSLANALDAPRFVIEALASSTAALLGLFAFKEELRGSEWGGPLLLGGGVLLLGAVATAVWWLRRSGEPLRARLRRAPRWLWVVVVIMLTFWTLVALNQVFGRTPSASRYQYPGAILILLAFAEAFRGARISGRAIAIAAALTVVSVVGNLVALRDGERVLQDQSDLARAELGALELARPSADPTLTLGADLARTPYLGKVDAGSYYSSVDAYGSPADSPGELRERPEGVRAAADVVLARAVGLSLERSGSGGRHRCAALGGSGPTELPLRPGKVTVRSRPGELTFVLVRRFATEPLALPGALGGGSSAVVRIPPDAAAPPWRLSTSAPVAVCIPPRS
jgi:hypothetical protein